MIDMWWPQRRQIIRFKDRHAYICMGVNDKSKRGPMQVAQPIPFHGKIPVPSSAQVGITLCRLEPVSTDTIESEEHVNA